MTICPPESTYLRISVVSELTGTPESTLRDAILTGDLRGMQVARAWHTRLEDYNEWIETTGTRGGDVRTAPKRPLASDSQAGRKEDRGTGQADAAGSPPSTRKKAKRTRRRKVPLVVELGARPMHPKWAEGYRAWQAQAYRCSFCGGFHVGHGGRIEEKW